MKLFTIGYEGTTMDEFITALQRAGVERVIDVRALPLSRRPGFSKTPLTGALAEDAEQHGGQRTADQRADAHIEARQQRESRSCQR